MGTLIEWFRTHLHWLVFFVLEAASMVMLVRYSQYHSSIWTTQANSVAGKVLKMEADVQDYIRLKELNAQLVEENLLLQYNNSVMRDELKKLGKDTTYVEELMLAHLAKLHTITARVVDNSVRMKDNIITIDKGEADGVREEMGVVCGTGIVGIVFQTSEHYALVLPVLNSHSSISCRLRGTAFFGSLKWKGGSVLDAYIDDIPRHAKFKVGDVVETSGFSSIFPEGIFVGRVSEILNSADGQSYELKVRLSVDQAILRDVQVIDNPDKAELDTLRAHGMKEMRD